MTHRMTPPHTTIHGVALDGETYYANKDGVFLIPDEHAPTLAEQGWTTLDATGDKPPVGFAPARETKPRTRTRKTPDTTTEQESTDD